MADIAPSAPVLRKGESYVDAPLGKSYKQGQEKKRISAAALAAANPERIPNRDDEDGDGNEEDEGTEWVDQVQTTEHANELFGLFAALGNAGGRGGNSTNRNPLPRGRACETADWTVDLFKFLPPTTGSCGVPNIRVPLTLTLRHSRPHTWYFSQKRRSGVVEQAASTDSEEIIARFVNAAEAEAAVLDLDGQVDVIAMYMATVRVVKDGVTRMRTRTEYFDEELLRDFLVHRATKSDGLLQLFVIPTGSKASMVRARFVSSRLATVETRTNVHYITDGARTVIERAATFDGDEHLSRGANMPSTSAIFNKLNTLFKEVLGHVQEHIPETYTIGEATGYFRVHADSKLYFLYMPMVVLLHAQSQKPSNPDGMPLSPRVAKPVLAYSGSLPKDYFRCPCCGSVVAAVDRAQVPYRMVLQHLELLDASDGTMDGDSPALRAIAATLDKVSRNPQYYADLYRAAAKANPTSNVATLLQECGYPGGDLELDDKLESPAELICFRLLQLAVAGTLAAASASGGSSSQNQLSIAHYKWVRDHKPKILHQVRVFLCSECSLEYSNSLATTHSHSAAAALTADSTLFEVSAIEQMALRDPLALKEFLKLQAAKKEQAYLSSLTRRAAAATHATPASPGAAANAAKKPAANADGAADAARVAASSLVGGEEEVEDTRTEAELRKALSLPLLKPKLDRAKLARQRPWRVLQTDADALDAKQPRAISEEPRFAEVAALKGVQPKPDPRFLPSLRVQIEHKARQKRRLVAREIGQTIREANAQTISQQLERRQLTLEADGWEEADAYEGGEGGTFLTTSASAAAVGVGGATGGHRRQLAQPGRRPGSMPRLPTLGGGADGGSGMPEVVTRHHHALHDAAADQSALDAQLAALNGRMASLEHQMRPIQRKAIKRNAKQMAFTNSSKLNAALVEIRAQLVKQLPRVMDLFRSFDRNGDGRISRTEFVKVLPLLGLPQHGASEMDAMFDVLDVDRNGHIEFAELNRLLRAGADVQLAAVMQAGAKGVIEVEARNRYHVRAHARDGGSSPLKDASVEEMRAAMVRQASRVTDFYRHLDVNGDGKVTRAEFRAALPLLGFGAGGIPAIDGLYEQLDLNRDGTVEYGELQAALRRDDVELAAELQDGAKGAIEVKAKNAIDLRSSG